MLSSFVDPLINLEDDGLSDPPPLAPKMSCPKHAGTRPTFMAMIPGTPAADAADGGAAAAEWVTLAAMKGEHKPSNTIGKVPLAGCFQPGEKPDFRHCADGGVATADRTPMALPR